MTRRRTLDKLDPPTAYQRIIERGPWASYARCRECGVDAGKACRDEDDKEALEVCDGRRLAINDSADRTRRAKAERPAPKALKTPEGKGEPKRRRGSMAPCSHCGTSIKVRANTVYAETIYCGAPDCRRAYRIAYEVRRRGSETLLKRRRASNARYRKRKTELQRDRREQREERAARAALLGKIDRQCVFCGTDFVAISPLQLYCDDLCSKRAYCVRLKKRKQQEEVTT